MTKVKPIRRLYFQFSGLLECPRLSADEIARILTKASLIEIVSETAGEPTHYRELSPKMSQSDYRDLIQRALVAGLASQGIVARPKYLPLTLSRRLGYWMGSIFAEDLTAEEQRALGIHGNRNPYLNIVLDTLEDTVGTVTYGNKMIEVKMKRFKLTEAIW